MTPLLDARDIAITGRLKPTSLRLAAGELVALIGPNGGGKTSLLRALADIEGDIGSVTVAGKNPKSAPPMQRANLVAFLPASREVVWPIRARDVIALASPLIAPDRVDELVEMLELGALEQRPINSVSTGERARVLLARALACEPALLLLDEPLSNLDPYWVLRVTEILRAYVASGRSAIVALHDLNQAEVFDRVLLVSDGHVLADGPPADVLDSGLLVETFAVERTDGRWQIRRPAGLQSLR